MLDEKRDKTGSTQSKLPWRHWNMNRFRAIIDPKGATLMKTALVALAFTVLALSSADAQYYRYDPYYYDGPPPRVVVRPHARPYFDDYSYYYPAVRGFGDRNPVPRGNMRGCTVDLGYGRYETCDKGH